jgi:hypothetical protein
MYDGFDFQITYPVMQWHNGARSNKASGGVMYTGGWLLPVDALPPDTKVNTTWKGPLEWTFESGKSETVYAAGEIFVALLRRRRRWFGVNGDGATVYYTDEQARGRRDPSASPSTSLRMQLRAGLRSHTQVLSAVMGAPVPLVLSVKGERSRALDKALSEFYQKVILLVNAQSGAAVPLYHYWCKLSTTVAVLGDEKGFITVGSGKTTKVVALPAAIVPDVVDAAYLQKAAVPDALRDHCARWRAEAEAWSQEWTYNPNPAQRDVVVDPDTGEIIS